MNTAAALQELERFFLFFNEHLYGSQLPPVMITIQSSGRRGNVFGWFTPQKLWSERQENSAEQWHEINLVAENLCRPAADLAETVLHEMAHLYAKTQSIQDTSTNGKYHNKSFKAIAEAHGLLVEHGKTVGWSLTSFNPAAKELLRELQPREEAFAVFRSLPLKIKAPGKKLFTFRCDCGETIKSENEEVRCLCEVCNSKFVRSFRGGSHA